MTIALIIEVKMGLLSSKNSKKSPYITPIYKNFIKKYLSG